MPLAEVFSERLLLQPGELLAQVRVPRAMASRPWFYRRRVRKGRFDYPLVTTCFLRADDGLRMAVSGAFNFPVRSPEAEKVLNDDAIPLAQRPAAVVAAIPHPIVEDMRASAAYRRMLFEILFEPAQEGTWEEIGENVYMIVPSYAYVEVAPATPRMVAGRN